MCLEEKNTKKDLYYINWNYTQKWKHQIIWEAWEIHFTEIMFNTWDIQVTIMANNIIELTHFK